MCLGMCALHSKELAKTHMVLLLQVNVPLKWLISFSPERVDLGNMAVHFIFIFLNIQMLPVCISSVNVCYRLTVLAVSSEYLHPI